jgi:RNA polymerase sigma-70 factor (sigma-E family)
VDVRADLTQLRRAAACHVAVTLLIGTQHARRAIVELPRRREGWMDTDVLFAQFVREQTPQLLRSAYLLTGSSSAAEDLVQDTLVRLFPKWDRVMAADVPLAYVRRSLVNGFLNQLRRPASRELVLDELPELADARDVGTDVTTRDLVWRLLATLPERQRAALVLRFFHDLDDDEIAAYLNCRPGTVRSLISRGLASLRGIHASAGER